MRDTYRTPEAESSCEIAKIKGSRFIGTAAPATTVEEAEAFVRLLRERYPDSRHTCFAYRLGPAGDTFRCSDDGEPSGSAGRPILRQIEGHDLTDTVVVVTRYFGGTKLGVGGLVRAYGQAASAVLEEVSIREVRITRRVVVVYGYEQSSAVNAVVAAAGCRAAASSYGEAIRQEFDLPPGQVEAFRRDLMERTGGRVEVELAGGDD